MQDEYKGISICFFMCVIKKKKKVQQRPYTGGAVSVEGLLSRSHY